MTLTQERKSACVAIGESHQAGMGKGMMNGLLGMML
eukprot:CAMPEP_0172487584 /NCGR_PEP_ID=MMETSP1066-20121228/16722_1 /TAXON_ID=671091 /ORGANISM="Coscinodiscus wailesii, Strain CCMP2513" /LENGTH=35 /DNA_ID= /DNA_START= /DNA_END= /DNA_ORIENTATION=